MEDIYYNPIELAFSLTGAILPLIIFLASAYYLSKKTDTITILLAVGTFAGLLSSISFTIIPRFINSDFYGSPLFSIIQSISFLGRIAFVVGFVMLIMREVKKIDYWFCSYWYDDSKSSYQYEQFPTHVKLDSEGLALSEALTKEHKLNKL